jgi:hypothetical protein
MMSGTGPRGILPIEFQPWPGFLQRHFGMPTDVNAQIVFLWDAVLIFNRRGKLDYSE